ncbi:MAG: hypothetical protein K8T90_05155 [Planctomycetes bacterium]|nr:hypothetical protein [Planctomycetota bacterium]
MKKQTKNAGKSRKAPKTVATPKAPKPAPAATPRERDPRLPAAGTTIKRKRPTDPIWQVCAAG